MQVKQISQQNKPQHIIKSSVCLTMRAREHTRNSIKTGQLSNARSLYVLLVMQQKKKIHSIYSRNDILGYPMETVLNKMQDRHRQNTTHLSKNPH
jgi:hypothetical protein